MVACLLGLGSNVGDREATLSAALREIDALPDVRLARQSPWHHSPPLGGPDDQEEYLNAAAVIETRMRPLALLDELLEIETRHGRQRAERWGPRTLDIDMLLYGHEVAETDMLALPHPRMSYRRFVLAPAADVAPRMLHPVIGWPIERLLLHLGAASDELAILSPAQELRDEAAAMVAKRSGAELIERPSFATAEQLWPAAVTAWLRMNAPRRDEQSDSPRRAAPPYAAAAFPKLTILLDAPAQPSGAAKSGWSAVVRQPGRGPQLRLQTADAAIVEEEVLAAIESVWPDLGRGGASRLE